MRTPILAVLGLALTACAGEITNTGPGGDDTGGAVCGNGTVEAGEQCDDGNMVAGDGCSATCQTEQATPAVSMTIDKPTIATELMTTNTATVTLTATGGFQGDVSLSAAVMDSTNAPITAWTTAFDHSTVTLAKNGTATATVTLTVPSDSAALSGTIQVSATATGVTIPQVTSAVTATNQVSFLIGFDATAGCVFPKALDGSAVTSTNPIQVKVNTKVRFVNMAQTATQMLVIHSDGDAQGICHENRPGGSCPANDTTLPAQIAPNQAYEQTAVAAGGPFKWYCHNLGDTGVDPYITVVN